MSLSDSDGKQLTAEQQEFFQNSKARDKDGNLLSLYHGTAANFTVFDLAKAGENYDGWSQYGQGIYLTPNKKEAQYFADNAGWGRDTQIMNLYANLQNPFNTLEEVGFDISDLVQKYELTEFDERFIKGAGYRLIEFLQTHNEDVRSYLTEHDYDGVWDMGSSGEVGQIVVYNENQVKRTDNLKPTSDPDIRRSLSQEGEQFAPVNRSEVFGKDIKLTDVMKQLEKEYGIDWRRLKVHIETESQFVRGQK